MVVLTTKTICQVSKNMKMIGGGGGESSWPLCSTYFLVILNRYSYVLYNLGMLLYMTNNIIKT